MRKYHARFLEGWATARSPGYSVRDSRPDLWAARGEIPRADPAVIAKRKGRRCEAGSEGSVEQTRGPTKHQRRHLKALWHVKAMPWGFVRYARVDSSPHEPPTRLG